MHTDRRQTRPHETAEGTGALAAFEHQGTFTACKDGAHPGGQAFHPVQYRFSLAARGEVNPCVRNGEGSIHRRKNGGWCAQYIVYTDKGRKRKTLCGKTRAEVGRKLAQAISGREVSITYDAGNQTVGEYLDRWLEDLVKDTVRQSTFERYEQISRLHVEPTLGNLKLKALAPSPIQGLYRERLNSGLSPSTVQKIHTVLHKALDQAVRWSLVPHNPTEVVKASRPAPEEISPLDRE